MTGNYQPPPNLPQIGGGADPVPSPIWGGLGWGGLAVTITVEVHCKQSHFVGAACSSASPEYAFFSGEEKALVLTVRLETAPTKNHKNLFHEALSLGLKVPGTFFASESECHPCTVVGRVVGREVPGTFAGCLNRHKNSSLFHGKGLLPAIPSVSVRPSGWTRAQSTLRAQ